MDTAILILMQDLEQKKFVEQTEFRLKNKSVFTQSDWRIVTSEHLRFLHEVTSKHKKSRTIPHTRI